MILATHNKKKLDELRRILQPLGYAVIPGDALPDVEETGQSFAENACLKAAAGCAASGLPCAGDDSGLCVNALGGAPGVFSARYAGQHGNDGANIRKLLSALGELPAEQRAARFVCAICCCFPDGRKITAQGVCEGKIAFTKSGAGGFGYDPVFLPNAYPGKSMAELTPAEKDGVSHRGAALRALAAQLQACE
jgi:XTP/dITP diphosphohydrolase